MKKMDGPHFQILNREQLIMQKFTTSMHLHNIRFSSPNVISMDICNTSSHNWTISNFSRSSNILTSLIFCCAIKSYIIKVDMIMWGMLEVCPISWIIDLSSSWVSFTSGIHKNISIMENRYTDIHILRKWQFGWGSLQEYTKYVIDISIYVQGGFFDWSALRKFWHLELFWRDLHVIWHLVILRADQ